VTEPPPPQEPEPPPQDRPPRPIVAVPWTPELPGSPAPPSPDAFFALPPPLTRRPGWLNRPLLLIATVVLLLVIAAVIGAAISHTTSATIVSSSSTDGTFNAGDCVSLSATRVTKADCSSAHDAQIIQVIHGTQSCPAGTVEFEVTDGTGSLCLDKSNNAKG
jgi:hypothetical protein